MTAGPTTGTGASAESSSAGTSSAGDSEDSAGSAASSTSEADTSSSSESTSGPGGTSSTGTDGDSSTGSDEASSTGDSDSSGVEDGVLDIGIIAHNDCTFTVEPASITVPEGTAFTVNWVSSPASEVEFDIAKIDAFNQVPIVIGMEPASAYHDDIREWCGDLFTGTFDFRLTSCHDPLYIPVDCGG